MGKDVLWSKRHIFLEIYFMKHINCDAWGNVAQLRTFCSCFLLIQTGRLQQITWNIFSLCALSCKYVASHIFHAICFVGVRCALLVLQWMLLRNVCLYWKCFTNVKALHLNFNTCKMFSVQTRIFQRYPW